jgi:hypothetical protein
MSIESAFKLTNRYHKRGGSRVSHRERRAEKRVTFNQKMESMSKPPSANVDLTVCKESHAIRVPMWVLVGATLRGASLDDKLAEGLAPDASPLLAARAQSLVALKRRRALADNWLSLLVDAREPVMYPNARVPLVRDRIIGAKSQIEALAQALQAPMPTSRGVAMASSLLSDGSGPIYNRACSVDFASTLYEIIAHLDPITTKG